MSTCRCGHSGDGPHPCHHNGYTCGKPAQQRFYNARPVCLSGVQTKVAVDETWACDEHWESFKISLKKATDHA